MFPQQYPAPKSICICGHLGDGPTSDHFDTAFSPGHGACKACTCRQFTWKEWSLDFQQYLVRMNEKKEE